MRGPLFEVWSVEVARSAESVLADLRSWVQPDEQPEQLFTGTVTASVSGFVLTCPFKYRHIQIKNGFFPVMYGRVTPRGTGCVVRVLMSLNPFALVPLVFVWSIMGATALADTSSASPLQWVPIVGFFGLLPACGYYLEAGASRVRLDRALRDD